MKTMNVEQDFNFCNVIDGWKAPKEQLTRSPSDITTIKPCIIFPCILQSKVNFWSLDLKKKISCWRKLLNILCYGFSKNMVTFIPTKLKLRLYTICISMNSSFLMFFSFQEPIIMTQLLLTNSRSYISS